MIESLLLLFLLIPLGKQMKLYLSSYKLGSEVGYLENFISEYGNKIGYIQNAVDFVSPNLERRELQKNEDIKNLEDVGFIVSCIDLKSYFSKKDELREVLDNLNGIWIAGGNTFILRQAMKLSGLDDLIVSELSHRKSFLYAGYSAGCCILSASLDHLQIVDDPNQFPYEGIKETIWKGLGIIDFAFLPHYDSDHPESEDINKEIEYCIKNKILFLAIRDGEVIIEDNNYL